jgi:hypothetical protein
MEMPVTTDDTKIELEPARSVEYVLKLELDSLMTGDDYRQDQEAGLSDPEGHGSDFSGRFR